MTPMVPDSLGRALALNNAHAAELSLLDPDRLARLVDRAFLAVWAPDEAGFLIAFDQDAPYESPNFHWFQDRWRRFVYVDRVVVRPECRGRGHAEALYRLLFARAAAACHELIGCEVNIEPPNPASDRFHARLGFQALGSAGRGIKRVRYLGRKI